MIIDLSGKRTVISGSTIRESSDLADPAPASVDEVASIVVYVCSRQASATTGAALRVDGGVVCSIA